MTPSSLPRVTTILAAAAWLAILCSVAVSGQGSDQVALMVTVSDRASNYVTGLTTGDFTVLEDGVEQVLASVSHIPSVPTAFALVLDTSDSMKGKITAASNVALDLVRRLGPSDVARLITFSSRVDIAQQFTNDVVELERSIQRLPQPRGSTSLNNALFITLSELRRAAARPVGETRRYVIIVVSDGADTSSLKTIKDVTDAARRVDVMIYAVGLDDGRREKSPSELQQLAESTGGRQVLPARPQELATIGNKVLADLASQYTIRYRSSNSRQDGQWRRLEVRVNRSEAIVRTKQGYFASPR